jgi:hypothetical protein
MGRLHDPRLRLGRPPLTGGYRGGCGVGVPGPNFEYLASMARRTSVRGVPRRFRSITSRVMSRQMLQVAAWLVNVTVPSRFSLLM